MLTPPSLTSRNRPYKNQGCHFSTNRQISPFLLLLWVADWLIFLFLSEMVCFLPAIDQWSYVAKKCSNIQSSSIYNMIINIHLNLILFYSTIYEELETTFIFDKCVYKFMYIVSLYSMQEHSIELLK